MTNRHANPANPDDQFAAIDMGSNSFHLVVARIRQGEVAILDTCSEKVGLGAGLDERGFLVEEAEQRALHCLARFAQRLRGIPGNHIRVVGTNALRAAKNGPAVLARFEQVLGVRPEIIAGREEARLIYLGVAHTMADDAGRRLVIDIGGGSTEFIIGERFEPLQTESLHMGCVSYRQRFFANGRITRKQFEQAMLAAQQELLTIETPYRALGWQQVVASSGTARSLEQMIQAQGAGHSGIDRKALWSLQEQMLKAGRLDKLDLPGLKADRREIMPAGLAIMLAIFERLEIDSCEFSTGAVREGLLYDMLGRQRHEDVRDRTVQSLLERYHVDQVQAQRVRTTLQALLDKLEGTASPWGLVKDDREMLGWAALLHEIGLAVSHSQFHKHGDYLVRYSDLPGFSRESQQTIARYIRGHRRKLPKDLLAEMPEARRQHYVRCLSLLRLALVFCRARTNESLPEMSLFPEDDGLQVQLPPRWLEAHPLTAADLAQETRYFRKAGFRLAVVD